MRKVFLPNYKIMISLLAFAPLIGCVQVPHPFEKEAGKAGVGLTKPPATRLIIPVPSESLLSDANSKVFAEDMAKAMLGETVPAVVKPAEKGDWVLVIKAQSKDGMIVPNYSIVDPTGKVQAVREGMPVSVQDWSNANTTLLNDIAQQSAPIVNQVLTGLQARNMAADPHSLKNRAAKIYFKGVTGAPGDGNTAIARQFVISLPDKFNKVQLKPKNPDYVVDCVVSVTKGAEGTTGNPVQHVEIVWHILDGKGKEAGKISQINDVPAHSLDVYWGDTAAAVGQEAAGGVRHVISNYSGRDNKPLPEMKNPAKTAPLVAPPEIVGK